MDTLLLIVGLLLFVAWIIGLIVARPSIWRKITGNSSGYPLRRSFPVNRKKAY